jgi:hypothetical protein
MYTWGRGSGNLVQAITSCEVTKYTSGRARIESINLRNPSFRCGLLKNQAAWKKRGKGAFVFV